MNIEWQCPICKANHSKNVLQCYCGKWKDNDSKGRFIRNYEGVFRAINILNKNFYKPKSGVEITTNRNLGELILAINLNKSLDTIDEKIILFGKWVLKYLGCANEQVLFHVYHNKSGEKSAGKYDSQNYYGYKNIIINLKKEYGYESIVYTIAHECMHHFLYEKGIIDKDENRNEILTDVAVIYFGFGEFLENGCSNKSIYSYSDSNFRLGYLSDDEIIVSRKYLAKRRKQIENYKKIMFSMHINKMDLRYQELYRIIGETVGVALSKDQSDTIGTYANELGSLKDKIKEIKSKMQRIKETDRDAINELCKESDELTISIENRIKDIEKISNKKIMKDIEMLPDGVETDAIITVDDIRKKTNNSYSSYACRDEKVYSANHRVLNENVKESFLEKIKQVIDRGEIFLIIAILIIFIVFVVKILLF